VLTWKEPLKEFSFSQVRQTYPHLQKRMYDVLVQLTPRRLIFETSQVQGNKTFSKTMIDQPTFEIISEVMKTLLEEEKLIFTRDDLLVCWQRFHELIFAYEAVRQGIMTEKLEGDTVIYEVNSGPGTAQYMAKTKFRIKTRQFYQSKVHRDDDTL